MLKNVIGILGIAALSLVPYSSHAQYCSAGAPFGGPDHISNVQMGSINNTSTIPMVVNYQDWTQFSTDVSTGSTHTLTVTLSNATANEVLGVWIDWNKNYNFYDDAPITIPTPSGSYVYAITINVPSTAILGTTRMRIRCHYSGPVVDPCGGFPQGGEIEDYTINVVSGGANDAGIVAFDAPVVPVSPGLQDVRVSLQNFGTALLTNTTIGWSVNGVNQPAFNWIGSLGQTSVDTGILLGAYNFTAGAYTVNAWTSLPNGQADMNPGNDSASLVFYACNPLSGNYTIGGVAADFPTLSAAALALQQCGVSSPVTFMIHTGVYSERVVLTEVPGASSTNRVTFTSASGNPADVVIRANASGTSDNYTVLLSGGDFYTLKKLTIRAEDSTFARVVVLSGEASHNVIDSNVIISQPLARTATTSAGIYSDYSNDNDNIISHNEIQNGYYGILIYGVSTSNHSHSNKLINNRIQDCYYYGISLSYQDSVVVDANRVRFHAASLQNYGIYLSTVNGGNSVTANRVQLVGTGTQYGLYLNNIIASVTEPGLVANNMIAQTGNTTSTAYGTYLYNCQHQRLVYNSVRMSGTSQYSRALNVAGSSTTELGIRNNIFSNFGGGYAVYVASGATGFTYFDYNDLYTTDSLFLAYWSTGPYSTMASLQQASGLHSFSTTTDPLFYDMVELYPGSPVMDNLGIAFPQVTTDIDGNSRSLTTPDLGAVEYAVPANDAGVSSIVAPVSPAQPGANAIQVIVKNYGTANLTAVTIYYSVNGSTPVSTPWTGNLPSGASSAPVSLGSFNFVTGSAGIRAWTSLPNGVTDVITINDTATSTINVCSPLAGTYTIGDTALGADFHGFNAAVAQLASCGVAGPVTMNVLPGMYNEQVTIPEIIGASNASRVTFQSSTGYPADVVLHYQSVFSNSNFVLLLNGADFIDIRNMTIQSDTGTYGRSMVMQGECEFILIEGNRIQTFKSTSSGSCPLYAYPAQPKFTIISNNEIRGGYYGIYFYGSSATVLGENNIIENNVVANYNYYGIRGYYQDNFMVTGNQLSNASNSTTVYALSLGYCQNASNISGNRVTASGSSGNYLLYLTSCTGTAASAGLYSNNFLSYTGSGSTIYGIYISGSSYQNIFHNSVNITGGSTSSRGIYQYSTSNGNLRVVNNIICMQNGGYAVYTGTSYLGGFIEMDHNDLYTNGTNLAYVSSNLPDLSAWQSTTGLDSNSVSVNPGFASATSLYPGNAVVNDMGKPLPEVQTDIDGKLRSLIAPDPGAAEFDPPSVDLAVLAWESPTVHSCALTGAELVNILLFNNGQLNSGIVTVSYSTDGGTTYTTPEIVGSILLPGDTLNYVFLSTASLSAPGVHHCVAVVSAVGDVNPLNDTLRYDVYNISPIATLPFMETFETGGSDHFYIGQNAQAAIGILAGAGNPGYGIRASGASGGIGWTGYGSSTTPMQAWEQNTAFHGWAASCEVNALSATALRLEFDLRQEMDWSPSPTYSYFRVVANDSMQLADISGQTDFNPLTESTDPWKHLVFDLSALAGSGFNLSFQFANRYNDDKGFIDNIHIYEPPANDVGVLSVHYPMDSTCAGQANDLVVEVFNYGLNTQVNIPVQAVVNLPGGGSTSLPGILTDTLLSGHSALINLGQFNSTVLGSYSVTAYTMLAGDAVPTNDTATHAFYSVAPVSVFPYLQDFEAFATGTPGTFGNGWMPASTGAFEFYVNAGPTVTSATGPSGDHTTGNGKYVYAEGNNGFAMDEAILVSPCLDMTGLSVPQLKFWYHMYGADIVLLSVDVLDGGMWINDVHVIQGEQQYASLAPWQLAEVSLAGYASADKIRFRVIRGSGNAGDVAIDDVLIQETPPQEAALLSILSPESGCDLTTDHVSVRIVNRGAQAISGNLSASYQLSGGPVVTESVPTSIPVGDTLDYTFSAIVNLMVSQDSSFALSAWVTLVNDPDHSNDSASTFFHSNLTPAAPMPSNASAPPLGYASLNIINPLQGLVYQWYIDSTSAQPFAQGTTIQVGPVMGTHTYWAEARTGQEIGSRETGPGSTSTTYLPFYGLYDFGWSASLYKADELGVSGVIDSVSFYLVNTVGAYSMVNQFIRMAHYTGDQLGSLLLPGTGQMTTVFSGPVTYSGPGWYTFALSTPFIYNGTDNLLIVYENRDGSWASGNPQFRAETVNGIMAAYGYADGSMPSGPGTASQIRPDIRLAGDLLEGFNACPSPRSPALVTMSSNFLTVNAGGDISLCEGDSTLLNLSVSGGQTPYTYLWSPAVSLSNSTLANPIAFPVVTTTYSVTVSDNNGLTGTDDIIITVIPAPLVSLGSFAPTCINYPAFTLTGGVPSGGTYSGPGVTSGSFNPGAAGAGTHTILYSYTDLVTGCTGYASNTIYVDNCVGVSVQEIGPAMEVFPQPAHDMLHIRYSGTGHPKELMLIDGTGRLVVRAPLLMQHTDEYESLDVSGLEPGLYFLHLVHADGILTRKVILQ